LSTQVESQKQRQTLDLEWRRSKVLELNSQGYSQPEIAKILQVSLGTVNRDLSIIRQQARRNMEEHIQKRLPEEYHRCLTGLNEVLKTCWSIIHKPGTDDKTKLQATAIINDSYKYIMDLTTNGSIVTDAIKHVTQMQKDVTVLNRLEESIKADEQEMTTSGVF
jgi:predicted transcriptional regulator